MTSAGTVTVLHAFHYADGAYPIASLIQAIDGDFYGTTVEKESEADYPFCERRVQNDVRRHRSPSCTISHSRVSAVLSTLPTGPSIQATDGNFYGTTSGLNQVPCFNQCGKVFRMTPAGSIVNSCTASPAGRTGRIPAHPSSRPPTVTLRD